MKVILDLSERALTLLGKEAKEIGRSRKKHMELILSVSVGANRPKPKMKK